MIWLAVDRDGTEKKMMASLGFPFKSDGEWFCFDRVSDTEAYNTAKKIPKGTIKKLIGHELTYNDKPFEINGSITLNEDALWRL